VIPIIHIIGLPGSGKTTLAQKLSKKLKVPIFCIGYYRTRFPKTPIGEADAWLALFRKLSRSRWKNCILETTGLNSREGFLKTALRGIRGANGFTAQYIKINMNLSGSCLRVFVKFRRIVILIPTGSLS
jgi:hypothetical protein